MKYRIAWMLGLVGIPLTGCQTCRTADAAMQGEVRHLVNTNSYGVALDGYDTVAFFTDDKPVQGSQDYNARYDGATYWFATPEHRDSFLAEPAKYTPAYGGYCGYAASINRVSPVDVHYFQILDGRLVLQHNQRAWDLWNKDVPGNLVKADGYWPGLIDKNGRGERQLVNVDAAGIALEGHDPVAYFTDHHPVLGSSEHEAHYNGAIYRFASKEHRELFENDPSHYAPAFGGYCGYAASINKVSPVNIHIWQILDERLVLQHTPKAYSLFNEDPEGALGRADQNWPGLVACKGK